MKTTLMPNRTPAIRPSKRSAIVLGMMVGCLALASASTPAAYGDEPASSPQQANQAQQALQAKIEARKGKTPPRGVVLDQPKLDRQEPVPQQMAKVGVSEHRGDMLPLDLRFTDDTGKEVRLGDYFEAGKPVILDLGYYNCPMLCDLVMNGLSDAVKEMNWFPHASKGDYQIITVSIDPTENHKLAAAKKQNYIEELGDPDSARGWHFLTGDQNNIEALAQAVGFGYQFDDRQMQYAHPAVLFIITPQGKISRYLYGVKFPERTLRLSLVEASDGKIGSALDQIILTCFHYDPSIGSYSLQAMQLMRAGGFLTVLIVAGVIGFALLRERKKSRKKGRTPGRESTHHHGASSSM